MVKAVEFDLEDLKNPWNLYGENDKYIKYLESLTGVSIYLRGNHIKIEGPQAAVEKARRVINLMYSETQKGKQLTIPDITYFIHQVQMSQSNQEITPGYGAINLSKNGRVIKARTPRQFYYIQSMREKEITIAIGPAGTGKTYLAVAQGLRALLEGEKKRLILTRPVVEAGESLGFLPGDIVQKINPYLRPLFDAILDMIPYEDFIRLQEKQAIEIAPLAYMRGRTLNNAFIILDEAQNTTIPQMKMFLTRMGDTSRMVLTGDITQIDLPHHTQSGLIFISKTLKAISEIGFADFHREDIVRHPLVKKILEVFDREEKQKDRNKKKE